MPNDLQPTGEAMIPERFRALSLDELQDCLIRAIGRAQEDIQEAARCVRLIEEKGGDLSYVPAGMLHTLRQIAYGQILPEIAVRFVGQPARLRVLSRLVQPDQKKIVESGAVEVVIRKNGNFDTRKFKPEEMTPDQFDQVFDRREGRIREPSEQIAILESEARAVTPKPAAVKVCPTCGQTWPKGRRRDG